MIRASILSAIAVVALSSCTHLETTRDYTTGSALDEAVEGMPYALPDLHYELAVEHAIVGCPREFSLAAAGSSANFWDDGLKFQTKVTAAPHYVAGERFLADYRSLASFMKTSGYGLETYPNGVLKSLNVSAEDQSAPLIKDVVAIGLGVARLAGGISPGEIVVTSTRRGPASVDDSVAAAVDDEEELAPEPVTSLVQALQELQGAAVTTRFPLCRDRIARSRAALVAATSAAKTASAHLQKVSRQVARHSLIAGNDRSVHADLEKLDKALGEQAEAEDRAEAARVALEEAKKALMFADSLGWTARSSGEASPLPPTNTQRLDQLLFVHSARVLRAADFNSVWRRMTPAVKAGFRSQFVDLVKAYQVDERDPPNEPELPTEPVTCEEGTVAECVVPGLTLYPSLTAHSAPNVGEVPPGAKTVSPTSGKPSAGLFIRSQQLADFRVCIGRDAVADCPAKRIAVEQRGVPAPQLGQLRFLPFTNRMFEAAKLGLSMREDGSVEKFSYDRTRAVSSGSEVVKDALSQYDAYRTAHEKERADALTTARAQEIATIDHQIAVLTKQAALLKLQEPVEPSVKEALDAESALINSEVALLNAKLAKLKAEAALAEGGGD